MYDGLDDFESMRDPGDEEDEEESIEGPDYVEEYEEGVEDGITGIMDSDEE